MAKLNLLNSIKVSRPKKSVFDLSHDVKLTCNMGDLIPVYWEACVPTDKIRVSQEALMRLMPMVAPMMHEVNVTFHTFFVPWRILWDEKTFEKWVTNQKEGGVLPAFPTVNIGNGAGSFEVAKGSLLDYLDLPLTSALSNNTTVTAMPLAAYQMIYNEYYRDQNQIPEVDFKLVDGDNTTNTELQVLRKRAWEHDYFTACAPSPQAGEAVDLPIGQFQDVNVKFQNNIEPNTVLTGTPLDATVISGTPDNPLTSELYAETSELMPQATTINDLRTAFRLQEWLEKSMRGGRRLFENILIFFGAKSPDARLQRPEYISGTKTPIQISEVLQTSETATSPQGNMAGHGITYVKPKSGEYYVQEWGYVMTIMSILPKTTYQQGINRHWKKYTDPMELYWPQFDHLGEQQVNNEEIFAYGVNADEAFGYLPRYTEYKFRNSRVAGEMRDTLDFWHMGRIFETQPSLNQSFIEADPTHRVFAVTDPEEQKLIVHIKNIVRMVRPMSKYSTPTF